MAQCSSHLLVMVMPTDTWAGTLYAKSHQPSRTLNIGSFRNPTAQVKFNKLSMNVVYSNFAATFPGRFGGSTPHACRSLQFP